MSRTCRVDALELTRWFEYDRWHDREHDLSWMR